MKRILLLVGVLSCWIGSAQITAPFTENFNGTAVPAGWNLSATTGGPWLFQFNANSVNCPAPSDHTNNGGNYAWMDQSGGDATVIMEMDTVDITALTVPYLQFYYWMCGVGYTPPNTTEVQAWDGAAWQQVTLLTAATNGWERQGFDLTNFTFNTNRVLLRFIAESGGNGSDFFGDNSLDDIGVIEAPTCIPPSNLSVANLTATTADVSWVGATGNLTFDVIWGTTGFDPQTAGSTMNTAASPYSISSLVGNTVYDAYIIADCGVANGQADTVGPISFRTACVPEAIGYFNGFENDATNATPLCWTGYETAANSNTNVITFSGPFAGVNHVNLSSSTASIVNDTIMLMTPQLTGLTSGNNQVRFFSQADNLNNTMIVGTVSSPSNPGSFVAIDTVRYSNTFTYEEVIIPISLANGYNGIHDYVAFKHGNTQTFTEVYIDDFNYEVIPPCPKVTGIAVTNVGFNTVTLSFNSSGTTTGYEWGPVGFVQGTGTTDTIQGNPITISGLSPQTSYDVYLRNDCTGPGNGTSIWTGPITFTTLCALQAAPYTQDFESSTIGHWDGVDDCWSYVSNNPGTTNSGGYSFEVRNSAQTTSGGTGPDRDNTLAPAIGGRFITADVSGSSTVGPDSTLAISPLVDVSTLTVPQLDFYYHKFGTNMPDINVDVFDGTWHRNVLVISGVTHTSVSEAYLKATLDLSTYGDTLQVRFRLLTQGCCQGDVGIDDFSIAEAPPCPDITSISLAGVTGTTASFSFTGGGSTTGYEWGPTGFGQGTGTTDTVPGNPINVTGLSPQTTYDIYLRNDCSGPGNGTSNWFGPFTFTTLCAIQAAPYFEDFESSAVGHWDGSENCWDFESNNPGANSSGGYSWEIRNTSQVTSGTGTGPDRDNTLAPAVGGNFVTADVSGSLTGGPDSTMITSPEIDVTALTVPQLSFYYHKHGANMPDLIVDVFDGTWHSAAMVVTGVTHTSQSEPYLRGTLDLSAYADTLRVRFKIKTLGCCQGDIGLDDVRIGEAPTCDVPSILRLVSRTSSAGVINWVSGGSALGTIIEYGSSGFTPGTGMSISTTDTIDTITGLSSNTSYDVYIYDSCGLANGNSLLVGPLTFTTKCLISPTSLPWNDGFENYAVGPYQAPTDFCNPTFIWEYLPTVTQGRMRVNAGALFVKSGTQAATLDNSAFISPSTTNFLTLNVNLSNYTTAPGIELSFSVLEIAQEDNPDNRVWIRGSSTDPWIELVNLDLVTTSGTYVDVANIDILGPLSNAGQTIGAETQIRFGQNGVSSAFSTGFSDGFSFDDVSLNQVTCPTPSGLSINDVSDTSSTLVWNGSTFANDYEVWYGPQGFFQGTSTSGGIRVSTGGPDSLVVDTLSANSCYEYLVRYICGAGDTSLWAGPYQYCTPCSPFFAPYFENYDAMVTNQEPDCWTSLLEGPGTPFAGTTVIGFNSFSTPNSMELDNWTGNNTVMAFSPLFGDINVGDKRIVFQARQNFGTGAILIVGTSDNPNSSLGFNPMDTISLTGTYTEYIVDFTTFNGYNGTDKFVGFLHGQQANFQPLLIDDFLYEMIPTCPKPNTLSLGVQALGATTAELEWNPGTPGNTNFEISYGTGITAPNQGTMSLVTGDSALLSGLNANTSYCFFVREICGPGDTSVWNQVAVCFTTLCLPYTAPYVQNFESSAVGHWDGTEDCWDYSGNNPGTTSSGGYSWEVRNTSQTTSGTGTGPDRDNTLAPAVGGNFVTADVSGSLTGGPDSSIISSPIIDISGLVTPEFEYFYHMLGTNMADLHVDIWNGTSWDRDIHLITGTQNTSQSDSYNDTIYDLANYIGQTDLRVRFRVVTNGCCSGDVAIDDIRISDPISCIKPINLAATAITGNGAQLNWDAAPFQTGANYQISYGASLSNPSLGTSSFTTADSLVISSLIPSSDYCFYVREICAVGDTSIWAGPFCFRTLCLAFTAPYFQDFETSTVGHWDGEEDCWDYTGNNLGTSASGGYSWEVRNTAQVTSGTGTGPDRDNTLAPAIGGRFITADVSGSLGGINPDSTIISSPVIDISGLTNPELEYYYHMHGSNMADLHVDIWNGTSWDRDVHLIIGVQNTSQVDPYNDTIYSLTSYVGQTDLRVRFRVVSDGCCQGDVALDDIRISDPVSCPKPLNLAAAAISGSGATLNWDHSINTTGTNFEVSYGLNITVPNTGTMVSTTADSIVLNSLTDNSTYCYFVREICAAGDTSIWVGPYCFSTLCLPLVAPYLQDFETSTVGHWDGENDCWTYFSNNAGTSASGGYSWEIRNTAQTTSGTGTGPDRDNTLAPAIGGNFITADVSGSSTIGPDSTVISSPNIDISGLSTPALQYYYHMQGTLMADLHVDIWNGSSWDNDVNLITGSHNTSQSDPYNDTIVDLIAYAGQTDLRVRFRAVTNGCCSGDIALDDIRLFDTILAPGACVMPNSLDTTNTGCASVDLLWNPSKVGASSILIYGPVGFDPNTMGNNLGLTQSPFNLTGLTIGTSYDFYVADTCTIDTSAWAGPFNFVTNAGPLNASFTTVTGIPTLTNLTVTVDATLSQGANTYTWDWGDGTPNTTGITTTHDYLNDGGYNIKLIIDGDCGKDSLVNQVLIAGISLGENELGRSLSLYPNPTKGLVHLEFISSNSTAVVYINDLSGRTVKQIELNSADGRFEENIDIVDFSKGTYILKIESGNLNVKRRIVKY